MNTAAAAALPREHRTLENRLFVGGLPFDATEAEIVSRFSNLPGLKVSRVELIRDAVTNGAASFEDSAGHPFRQRLCARLFNYSIGVVNWW